MSKTCRQCGKNASILDGRRMLEKSKGDYAMQPEYLCLTHAREFYPDLFPPPPPQFVLPITIPKTRKVLGHSYVPLGRERPA